MFLQLTRLIAVLATTVNMGNAYDNQDNKVGDVLKQMDMKSSTTRSLDNIFQNVQEGRSSSNQDTAPPPTIQEANDASVNGHDTVVIESGDAVALASISILLDSSPTPKPTTTKKGKSVKTGTSKPTNSKSSKSKLTLSPTHQPTSQPDREESMDMNNHGAAPAPIHDVSDDSVDDQHDTVVAASGDVVALASIPVLLGDSAPTPKPTTTINKGKSVKTGTTSKPTNSKSSKSKLLLTTSPTHQPTSQPDYDGIMNMNNHDTAPAPTIQEINNANAEKEEVIAVPESDSGAASYSDSILIASVVVLPKSSKARMSMNQYDGFIGA